MDPFGQPAQSHPIPPLDKFIYGLAVSGFATGLATFPKTSAKVSYYLTGVGTKPGGGFGVSGIVTYYVIFPPPFGFGSASNFGLEPNYFRGALESLGVPADLIPESELFSTQRDTPAIEAERARLAAHVARNNYARKVGDAPTEQVLSDYLLAQSAALGELGDVPAAFPAGQIATLARDELLERGISPDELHRLLGQRLDVLQAGQRAREEARQRQPGAVVFVTATGPGKSPFPNAVPAGSLIPDAIDPVRDAARRNKDTKEGIDRALVHERADP